MCGYVQVWSQWQCLGSFNLKNHNNGQQHFFVCQSVKNGCDYCQGVLTVISFTLKSVWF